MTAVLDVDKLPNGLLHKLLAIVNKHTPRAAEAPAPVVEKSVDVASSGTAEGLVGSKGPEGKDQDKDQDKNQNKNGESPALAVEKSEDVASGTAESLVSSEGKDQDKNQNKSQNEHDESPAPAVEKSGDASSSGIAEVYCTNQRQKKWQTEHDESPAPAVEKSGDASSSGITEVRSRNKNQNKKQKEHDESPAPANEKSGDTASSGTAEIRSENKNQNEHDESPAPANEKSGDIASSGTAEVLIGSENKNQNKSQTDEHNESSAPALENLGDAASCGTAEVPVYAEGNKQNKKQHEHDEFPAFAIEESSDAASSGTAEVPDVRRAQESLAPSLPVAEVALHTRIYDILRDPLPMIASTLFFLAFIWCLHQVWYARQERQMWMAANQDAIKANVLLRTSPVEIIQRWGWLTPQKVRYLYAAKYTHRHAMYTPMAELKPPTTCTLRYGLYMPLAIVRNRWMQWLHAIPTRASSPTKVAFLTSPTPGATPSFVRMVAARVSGGV